MSGETQGRPLLTRKQKLAGSLTVAVYEFTAWIVTDRFLRKSQSSALLAAVA